VDLIHHLCGRHLVSFPLGPPVYVCVLHCSEGKRSISITGLLPVESVHVTHSHWGNLFFRGTGRIWTAGLMTTGFLVEQLRLWQPWHSFRTSLNWTDVAWHSSFVIISVNNQFRYFVGLQQLWPLVGRLVLHQHSYWQWNADLEETSSLCNTTLM